MRIVIKKRKKEGDALDDGRLQLLVEIFPIAVVPAFNGFELFLFVKVEPASRRFVT
jgi:hypothetical protein